MQPIESTAFPAQAAVMPPQEAAFRRSLIVGVIGFLIASITSSITAQ